MSSSADASESTSASLRCAYSATSAIAMGHHAPTTDSLVQARQLGLEKRTQGLTPSYGRGDFFTADATTYPQWRVAPNRRARSLSNRRPLVTVRPARIAADRGYRLACRLLAGGVRVVAVARQTASLAR